MNAKIKTFLIRIAQRHLGVVSGELYDDTAKRYQASCDKVSELEILCKHLRLENGLLVESKDRAWGRSAVNRNPDTLHTFTIGVRVFGTESEETQREIIGLVAMQIDRAAGWNRRREGSKYRGPHV